MSALTDEPSQLYFRKMPSPIRSGSESATIPDFNVVLFGAAGVGKSALVRRFLNNSFFEIYQPTVEETYSTVLQTMSCMCVRLVLIDTAGLHPFPAMRELRMRTGNAFIFVFSYDSADSLQEAIRLHSNLQRIKGAKFDPKNVIFVGNKADLLAAPSVSEYGDEEKVEREDSETSRLSSDGESGSLVSSVVSGTAAPASDELYRAAPGMIEQLGSRLIETSARFNYNVIEVFHSVLFPLLFARPNLANWVTPAYVANSHFKEDSPIRRVPETEAVKKKISWPWPCASDHPTRFPFHSGVSPPKHPSPNRSRFRLERRQQISCVENDLLAGGNSNQFLPRDEVNRKFSVGSRLLASPRNHFSYGQKNKSNNHLSVIDDTYNRPACRSHSVDNSLADKANVFRDTNSTESAFSGCIYSSLSSVEKENLWKLSVSSVDSRHKHGRFLSPSPKRSSRDCEKAMDLCLHSLDFVQEVGHCLDPSHRTDDVSEPRVPCFQVQNIGRRGKSPQPSSLNRERVKKCSVFSQPNFCLMDQVCKPNEPISPEIEHEFNLVVPDSHKRGISKSYGQSPNCKVS
ncbi:hypothetical protein Aperf_G00000031406 [Anoplocephala perfoliata]